MISYLISRVKYLEHFQDQKLFTNNYLRANLIKSSLTENEKLFLLSFKNMTPDWTLLGLEGIENMPAIKWKMLNLKKMKPASHRKAYEKLEDYLLK